MKEMVGGCCVCSDERGWAENPLVYCDGQGCTVAVHQACYGIVTVPTGPWFCRKCECLERAARVRCELCPSRDGALKRTDNSGWAHVVCALYIPEVRFGNVTTMEPIILQLIPAERFSKVCYICEEQGKGSRSTVGACMQCNKSGCKQQFHVTCAQALGLLCEEAGNYLDNVKYCGYCQHHYSKLRKGGNVKTIPPYKPIPADNGSSDSSPEKESDIVVKQQGIGGKRKSGGKAATAIVGAKGAVGKVGGQSPAAGDALTSSPDVTGETSKASSPSSNKDIVTTGSISNSIAGNSKFTTSNFVESIVTPQGESVFVTDVLQQNPRGGIPSVSGQLGKKRKSGGSRTPTSGLGSDNSSDIVSALPNVTPLIVNPSNMTASGNINTSNSNNPSTNIAGILDSNAVSATLNDPKKQKVDTGITESLSNITNPLTQSSESVVVSNVMSRSLPVPSSNVITSTPGSNALTGIVVSVPLTAASLQPTGQVPQPLPPPPAVVTTAPTLFQQLQQSVVAANNAALASSAAAEAANNSRLNMMSQEEPQGKRASRRNTQTAIHGVICPTLPGSWVSNQVSPRSQSTERAEKGRNKKRGSAGVNNTTTTTTTTTITTTTAPPVTGVNPNKRGSRSSQNTNTPPPPPVTNPQPAMGLVQQGTLVKDSPPSSPGSETTSVHSSGRRSKNKKITGARDRDEKDLKLFQNGVSAPHMLGNQLNPSSTMAQKMSDTLSAELEAHSIFTDSTTTSSLIGPQLHSRVIASVRSGIANANSIASSANIGASTPVAGSNTANSAAAAGSIPQSLDQLLERQWEQGSQFLMEQAQHFDIASLLSCLHQLRAENLRLEEHVNSLLQRRDHLLAVNARLAIPLTTQPPAQVNNVHPGSGSATAHQHQDPSRNPRVNNSYLPHPMENGLPPEPSPPSGNLGYPHQHRSPLGGVLAAGDRSLGAAQPSPTIRQSPAGSGYMLSQSPLNPPPSGSATSTPGVVRSTSATPDPMRANDGRRSSYPVYQVSSPAVSSHQNTQVPVVTTQQMVIRRDTVDMHHQLPSSKPS